MYASRPLLSSFAPCWQCWLLAHSRRSIAFGAAHAQVCALGGRTLCGMGKHRKTFSEDTPGDFDIYLLAQTWAPQFCCTKSDRCTTVSCALLCQLTLMLTVTLTLTPTRSAGPTRPGTSRCTASGQRTRCHATRVVTVRHRLRPTVP